MGRLHPQRLQWLVAGLMALLALALYSTWLAPSVATIFDDSLEFQLVTYRLGIAHPTGYPLYTLLGKLFTFLPVGDVAYRVNLMSAVFGGAAVGLVYLLALALAAPAGAPGWEAHAGAALAAAIFGLGPVFAGQATIAEVYTLNALFVAAVLWLAVQTGQRPSGRRWLALALVYGLSLTHHRTMLLLLPALALSLGLSFARRGAEKTTLVLRPPSALTFNYLIAITLAFSLPLLLYLYLPLRGHVGSLDGTYRNTWAGFWQQVTGGGYGVFIFGNPFGQERGPESYAGLFREQFGGIGLGLLAAGLAALAARRRWAALVLTGGAFVTYTAFNLLYTVADIEVFFIPAFLIGAVWLGQGLHGLAALLARRWGSAWPGGLFFLAAAALILVPARGRLAQSPRPVDRSGDWAVYDYAVDLLNQPLPPDSALVGILGEMTLVRYFQETAGLRPDLQTVAADLEPERLAAVERLLAEGRPVFLTRPLPGAAGRWSLSALGPLIRVQPGPETAPPAGISPLAAPLTDEIVLMGYSLERPPSHRNPPPLRLTLYWQAAAPVPLDLKVSARLQTETGAVLAAEDAVPVHFAYPTTAWRPGEVVRDVYDLTVPPGAATGEPVMPVVILYDPARNAAEVGRVALPPLPLR